jgi:hypothetical protein
MCGFRLQRPYVASGFSRKLIPVVETTKSQSQERLS